MMATVVYTNNPTEFAGEVVEILLRGAKRSKVKNARQARRNFYSLFITSVLFNDYVLYLIALSITTLATMFRGFNDVLRWQHCLADSGGPWTR